MEKEDKISEISYSSLIFDKDDNYYHGFDLGVHDKVKIDFRSYAKVVTSYCVDIHEGQTVLIMGLYSALPLIKEIYREILKKEAYPVRPLIDFPGRRFLLYKLGSKDAIKMVDPMAEFFNQKVDVVIQIYNMLYPGELDSIPTETLTVNSQVYDKIDEIKDKLIEEGKHQEVYVGYPFKFNVNDLQNPTDILNYQNLSTKAYLLDRPDPIAAWSQMENKGNQFISILKEKSHISISSSNLNLEFTIDAETLENSVGHSFIPDGKIIVKVYPSSVCGSMTIFEPEMNENLGIKSLKINYQNGKANFDTRDLDNNLNEESIKALQNSFEKIMDFEIGLHPVSEIEINNPISNSLAKWGMKFIFEGLVILSFCNNHPKNYQIFDLRQDGCIKADDMIIYNEGHLQYPQ